jgi:hypothetical protein
MLRFRIYGLGVSFFSVKDLGGYMYAEVLGFMI